MLERSWLFDGIKPFPILEITNVPVGSLVSAVQLDLSYWVNAGVLWFVGTDLYIPTFRPVIGTFSNGKYTVIGSNWTTEVELSALDWYMVLPEGAVTAFGSSIGAFDTVATNAVTVELLLGKKRAFGMTFAESAGTEWTLMVRNFVTKLSIEIYCGNTIYWSNDILMDNQGYNTSLYYTPLRFTVIFGSRTGNFYGSHSHGTAMSFANENVALLIGLTPNPIMLSITRELSFGFGSFWLTHDPYFLQIGESGEGDCWLRLWMHRLTSSMIYFSPPVESWTWMHQDCRVYNATLGTSGGYLTVSWQPDRQPILGRLVCGTVIYCGGTYVSFAAPVQHVSYTSELTNEAISASASISLTPFKLSDWSTYQWTGIPLLLYRLILTHRNFVIGTLFIGARVGISAKTEQNAIYATIETADNQALLRRYSIDVPVCYDYWSSEDAARNLLARFGLKFERNPDAPNLPLLPEWYSEKSLIAAWVPRLGETVLDFFNRIAQLNGWRVDWTVYGTVVAYPKWATTGRVWSAYWPTPDQAILIADLLVSKLNVQISDYERRNLLILFGVDAWTQFDVIKVFADLESFLIPSSDRFMPFAVPAFVKFDKPIPAEWMDYLGQQITARLFVTPFELEFIMPLTLKIKPGDSILFQNQNPMNFHRYEFVITRVRHEIGREYSTVVSAMAFKQRQ